MAKQKPYWWPVFWGGYLNLWTGEYRINRNVEVLDIGCAANHGFKVWIVVLNVGIRFGWEEHGYIVDREARAWVRVREKLDAIAAKDGE